jgi:hypothetical protein
MLARSAAFVALTACSLAACAGDTTPEPHGPVRPGPIVAWTPPAASTPPQPPVPARTQAAASRPSAGPSRVQALPSEPGRRCELDGVAQFVPNTPIQSTDGRVIGRFSGVATHVTVNELTFALPPRAHVMTGNALGSFRLRGYVAARDLPLFTTASISIAAEHVAIGAHRGVSLTGVSPDKLKIERVAAPPLGQTFTAWTTCSALSLEAAPPPAWSPPGDARGYALKKDALELLDGPDGAAVGAVRRAPGAASVLFFGGEQSGGFVHVERHADIVIDAWARASELTALPRGETLDQAEPPLTTHGAPHLALANEPRVLKPVHEVTLRAEARELDAPIGVIGADTETYVIDVMAGWVSVMPKAMDVLPPEGGAFWAKKADLGG